MSITARSTAIPPTPTAAAGPPAPTAAAAGAPGAPSRRGVLLAGCAAGATGLLAGCASSGPGDDSGAHASATDRLRSRAGRDSTALVARYDATVAAHPGLAPLLRPLRDDTARHAAAFGERDHAASPSPAPSSSSSSATDSGAGSATSDTDGQTARSARAQGALLPAAPGPARVPADAERGVTGGAEEPAVRAAASSRPSPSRSVPPVPRSEGQALAALASAEQRLADARVTALLDAPAELARLLASTAACGAAHAYLLTRGRS